MNIVAVVHQQISSWMHGRIDNERGAALVEYALLLALIAVFCIVALQVLGGAAADKFDVIGSQISDAGTTPVTTAP